MQLNLIEDHLLEDEDWLVEEDYHVDEHTFDDCVEEEDGVGYIGVIDFSPSTPCPFSGLVRIHLGHTRGGPPTDVDLLYLPDDP